MFDIKFSTTSSSSSNAKRFKFTFEPGQTVTEKVPPQAQQIIHMAYYLSEQQDDFSYNELIKFIEDACTYSGTTFTNSKGGVERIVRYYAKLLQELGIITDVNSIEIDDDPTDDEDDIPDSDME